MKKRENARQTEIWAGWWIWFLLGCGIFGIVLIFGWEFLYPLTMTMEERSEYEGHAPLLVQGYERGDDR